MVKWSLFKLSGQISRLTWDDPVVPSVSPLKRILWRCFGRCCSWMNEHDSTTRSLKVHSSDTNHSKTPWKCAWLLILWPQTSQMWTVTFPMSSIKRCEWIAVVFSYSGGDLALRSFEAVTDMQADLSLLIFTSSVYRVVQLTWMSLANSLISLFQNGTDMI